MLHHCRLDNFSEHQAEHRLVAADLDAGMRLLRTSLRNRDAQGAYEVAEALLDIWTERELAHAQAEELWLYETLPILKTLRRDHDLMATWVNETRELLDREGRVSPPALMRLEALETLLHTHHDHEMQYLHSYCSQETAGTFPIPQCDSPL
ncbi:MAG: hypothetical protein M1294_06720 [Firmicutes bacterium]|jgi:hypothetical protein|uniref:Hemerythrin-like domain-containing protein n=1 Tax=Sulfobacillus benefaciens TaxID=453960 RepID=A0A2T2WLR3_9FIRM|nr:hypothetical protein [Bacillota bacterium]MCL5014975.1 hypothetical protein [Bacillota bacterium]PSR23184.1 MAG: hypothetical protein C7B43_20265 [Sulfobacillus benefaciens]HBQ94965.1 hypothetical protein [Sulfobacillus sp.]